MNWPKEHLLIGQFCEVNKKIVADLFAKVKVNNWNLCKKVKES